MKILITGGFGYIGGRFTQHISKHQNCSVILATRSIEDIPSWALNFQIQEINWNDNTQLKNLCVGVDIVVHLAGMNAHDCLDNPGAAFQFNGVTTAKLLNRAIQARVKRFIYLSTAHVYGNPLAGTLTEDSCLTNLHPYATSHRHGEMSVLSAKKKGRILGCVIRLSNAFGAPANKNVNCWMLLVNDLCRQAVSNRKIVLRSSGQQKRNFIGMHDVCRSIEHTMMLSDNLGDNGLFNLGDVEISVLDMARMVQSRCDAILGFKPELVTQEIKKNEDILDLNYRSDKFFSTGFKLKQKHEPEIDETLILCKKYWRS
jgi:UDP-glucose 4-epimerase